MKKILLIIAIFTAFSAQAQYQIYLPMATETEIKSAMVDRGFVLQPDKDGAIKTAGLHTISPAHKQENNIDIRLVATAQPGGGYILTGEYGYRNNNWRQIANHRSTKYSRGLMDEFVDYYKNKMQLVKK